jgi:glycosyltransferase involved in cell wall biosynthesis
VRVLHAIHDFLPRHRAGSEIYARDLCGELERQGIATHVLCAEYDPARPHGSLAWRIEDDLGVTEVVNNWAFDSFAESYEARNLVPSFATVLDAIAPDVLHLHSLLNLSFALPALARARGIPVVATIHDYTLVCPSGGQRYHLAERWICREIEPERCARCFPQHALGVQLGFGRVALAAPGGRWLGGAAKGLARRLPWLARAGAGALKAAAPAKLSPADFELRLRRAHEVFAQVDTWVSPSAALAREFAGLGFPPERLEVSALGHAHPARPLREPARPLRVGYVGTLIWHKGVHLLIEAARQLRGAPLVFEIWGDPAVAPDYADLLRRSLDALPVRLRGGFDDDRRAAVYSELDVLVVPSLWLENSPLVVREAFEAGLPVVAARIGGLPELVEDGKSGLLFDPDSASDLARALWRLTDEPGLWSRLAQARPPLKTLSQDAAEWGDRYRNVAGRRRAAP